MYVITKDGEKILWAIYDSQAKNDIGQMGNQLVRMYIYFLGSEEINLIYEKKLSKLEGNQIIEMLKKKFCDLNSPSRLLWCSLKQKPACYPFSYLKKYKNTIYQNLYFYLEREGIVFYTSLNYIVDYVNSFEECEEIDAYIFDLTFQWLIVITHEDRKILYI